jgi:hypothetical protein
MPVNLFTDGLEPDNPDAPVWRFMEFWKFRSMIETGTLYFCRADKFAADESEGLPPEEYLPFLGLNKLDLIDRRKLDDEIGSIAQFRQSFFINCWYLGEDEAAQIWEGRGEDAVAIRCRYSALKSALAALSDDAYLGLIRYGSAHLTGWNIMRFITTKRLQFEHEREVRALLWIRDERDGINRHFDENNIPHDRPLLEPLNPQEGVVRPVNCETLIERVVLNPWAADSTRKELERLIATAGLPTPVQPSEFTRYRDLLPYSGIARGGLVG